MRLGALTGSGDETQVTGFAIDHRKDAPGTVFGAYRGARFDGEDFVADAISSGAVAVVARPEAKVEGALHIAAEEPRLAFARLAATFFACCLAHAGPIFHVVSYAMVCGLSALAAVSIYSLQGLAGLGGRLLLGVLADRHGAKPVLIGGLLLQALAIGAFLPASSLGEFYAVATVFGLAYGGVMPLYAVLARDYFGPRIMGTVFGAATMVSCLGMAAGPAVGGWIFDRFGSYAGMHLSSLVIGLGAVAIAFTFPPLPRMRAERLRPA